MSWVSDALLWQRTLQPPAFNVGGVRELTAEGLRPHPHLRDMWRLRTPPEQLTEPRAHGGPDRHVEVPDPSAGVRMARGGPGPTRGGPGPHVLSISTFETRGDTRPVPEREAGPGSGPLVR